MGRIHLKKNGEPCFFKHWTIIPIIFTSKNIVLQHSEKELSSFLSRPIISPEVYRVTLPPASVSPLSKPKQQNSHWVTVFWCVLCWPTVALWDCRGSEEDSSLCQQRSMSDYGEKPEKMCPSLCRGYSLLSSLPPCNCYSDSQQIRRNLNWLWDGLDLVLQFILLWHLTSHFFSPLFSF